MALRPGRAIAAPLVAALLSGTALASDADVDAGPGPAPVPDAPVPSSQAPSPTGPGPEFVEPSVLQIGLGPAAIAAGVPVRVEHRPGDETWLDAGHAFVGSLLGTALRLDRFFSDERELDVQREQSFLRWRNDVRFGTDDHRLSYRTTLLADLKFPGFARWLEHARLVVAGETDDTVAALREGPSGSAGSAANTVGGFGRAAAELQYAIFETFRVKTDLGAGVILRLPPGLVGRLRLRWAQPVGRFLLRAAAVSFVRTDLGIGELVQGEVERPSGDASLVRLSGGATANHRERDRGIQWGSEATFIRAFGPRSAVSLGAGLDGVTIPAARVDTYRVYTRLRHDAFRQWIFVELEPEVSWPFDPLEPRSQVYAITVRLEAQFQERSAPRPAAAPPPPAPPPPDAEPKDPDGGP